MNSVIEPEQPEELHYLEKILTDKEIIIIKFNKEFTEGIYTLWKSY